MTDQQSRTAELWFARLAWFALGVTFAALVVISA